MTAITLVFCTFFYNQLFYYIHIYTHKSFQYNNKIIYCMQDVMI